MSAWIRLFSFTHSYNLPFAHTCMHTRMAVWLYARMHVTMSDSILYSKSTHSCIRVCLPQWGAQIDLPVPQVGSHFSSSINGSMVSCKGGSGGQGVRGSGGPYQHLVMGSTPSYWLKHLVVVFSSSRACLCMKKSCLGDT
jgi:hypothetical protein